MGASMSRTVTISLTAALAALGALAAGCGSSGTTSPAPTHSPGTEATSPAPSGQSQGQVGDKFTVTTGNTKYDVTLLSVDQQAAPDSQYSAAKAGYHLAATEFRVTAVTSTDENSNTNAVVTGSNDQSYTYSLSGVAAGTNFASGRILLQPGSSLVGWVSFELPNGVHVARVRWTPGSGFSTKSAEWMVNKSTATSPGPGATSTPGTTPAPTAPSSPGGTAPGQGKSPEDVVNAYFDAINAGNYQKAWNLGGKNTTSSYSSFVNGFKTTSMVSVQILDLSGDIGTGVVTARLTSLETDGSTKIFEGTYTVSNGVITKFNVRQVK